MTSWDVLIPTIPHRHEKLCGLLAEFDRQWQEGFGVLVLRDNLERPGPASHAKRQDLLTASRADYVSCVDDDDWVPLDYVSKIMAALAEGPDYVGFPVHFTEDGARNWQVEHSLRHSSWYTDGGRMLRDISHLNPIRRELALLADWNGRTDEEWAAQLRDTKRVQSEVWIPAEMYQYKRSIADGWATGRQPMPEPLPSLPAYPWLKVL